MHISPPSSIGLGSVGVDFLEPKQLTDSEIEYFKTRSERVAGYLSSNRQN